jgi:hypothetical protein
MVVRCARVSSNLEKKALRQLAVCATPAENNLNLKRNGITLASFIKQESGVVPISGEK